MLEFEWPWLWWALPLPWLFRQLLPPEPEAALRVPFLADFETFESARSGLRGRFRLAWWLALLAWLLLLAAACRPQWLGREEVRLPATGRDLMLAVDLSLSMRENDMQLPGRGRVNRLEAIKHVAGEFIERREGDRIGLILFGDQPYLQAPLSFDRETILTLLDEAEIGFLGRRTAIGAAIGLAIKRLRLREDGDRVLILLTDGANTAGEIEPLAAARYAAANDIRIYAIGVGAEQSVRRGLFGLRRVNSSADLDEKTLEQVAEISGGRYFRARASEELAAVYQSIDALEPAAEELGGFRPRTELFPWPLAAALVLGGLLLGWRVRTVTA